MVQRYNPELEKDVGLGLPCLTMKTNFIGSWVTYEDYQKLEAELEKLRQQVKAPADDGWIEWAGGECPVNADMVVDVKWRAGGNSTVIAVEYSWAHGGRFSDIMAYRIAE